MPKTWGCQIALIFPREGAATDIRHMGHHIDGEPNYMNDPNYSNPNPKLNDFNMLVGMIVVVVCCFLLLSSNFIRHIFERYKSRKSR